MFRKPKRKAKTALRKETSDNDGVTTGIPREDNNDEEEEETRELLQEARKRVKSTGTTKPSNKQEETTTSNNKTAAGSKLQYAYANNPESSTQRAKDLVTSKAEHHPAAAATPSSKDDEKEETNNNDNIYRGKKKTVNKFHAGPIKAATHVRVTARFDYQPDICKDYKETGFCGFGDTCIYLHDRGDSMSGWQLEQQYELAQKEKKQQQEQDVMQQFATGGNTDPAVDATTTKITEEDGIPFACHVCRGPFRDPVVTHCSHYFCESCIMTQVRNSSHAACPICQTDTGSVFNQPIKLMAKKRKLLGSKAAKAADSWEQYAKLLSGSS